MSRPSAVPEPFTSFERQRFAATFGMWIFLATEAIFFGGLFTGYTLYRFLYPDAFAIAGGHTKAWIGSANTAILLTSSATMAVAVWASKERMKPVVLTGLGLTAALGLGFLGLKGYEYATDVSEQLVPGWPGFPLEPPETQNLLLLLLDHDRSSRRAPDHRDRGGLELFPLGPVRSVRVASQRQPAGARPLLAPDRRDLDLPLSPPLPRRPMTARSPSAGRLWRKAALVWLALSALLAATIVCAYLPLGEVKLWISLTIAVAKALLVAIIFMELREDGAVTHLAAVAGLLCLAVLILLVIAEGATRQHHLVVFGQPTVASPAPETR